MTIPILLGTFVKESCFHPEEIKVIKPHILVKLLDLSIYIYYLYYNPTDEVLVFFGMHFVSPNIVITGLLCCMFPGLRK